MRGEKVGDGVERAGESAAEVCGTGRFGGIRIHGEAGL
jgi:hypothetical protein